MSDVEIRTSQKVCHECGDTFQAAAANTKWCPKCKDKSRCLHCGGPTARYKQRFCSQSCGSLHFWQGKDNQRPSFQKTCQKCGAVFFTVAASARKICAECHRCEHCNKPLRKESYKRFCSLSCASLHTAKTSEARQEVFRRLGDPDRIAQRTAGVRLKQKGHPRPSIRGEKSCRWKGGITGERRMDMARIEYKTWRATVLKRDSYTCVMCGTSGRKMQAHHIKAWADFADLRYDTNNGVTLCERCHESIRKTESQHEERFTRYAATCETVTLSAVELSRFVPFETECANCHAPLIRTPYSRNQIRHFCNKDCYRRYETTTPNPRSKPSIPPPP